MCNRVILHNLLFIENNVLKSYKTKLLKISCYHFKSVPSCRRALSSRPWRSWCGLRLRSSRQPSASGQRTQLLRSLQQPSGGCIWTPTGRLPCRFPRWVRPGIPLCRHDLGIGTRNSNTGVEAGPVVGLHDVPTVHVAGSHRAVVRALGSREPVLGPTEGMSVLGKECVLLLDTEPGMGVFGLSHNLLADLSVVGLCGLLVVLVSLAHHHDVLSSPEWIGVDLDGVQVGVAVLPLSLVGGATVIVPDGQLGHILGRVLKGLRLGAKSLSCSIDPDVQSLHPVSLGKVQVLLEHHLVRHGVVVLHDALVEVNQAILAWSF